MGRLVLGFRYTGILLSRLKQAFPQATTYASISYELYGKAGQWVVNAMLYSCVLWTNELTHSAVGWSVVVAVVAEGREPESGERGVGRGGGGKRAGESHGMRGETLPRLPREWG